ncbi:hypothetical protein HK101_008066 [Irineochytrium annulatum]|nr:hypothetical protein HK101_008066 [Irineochytrium annulatum]
MAFSSPSPSTATASSCTGGCTLSDIFDDFVASTPVAIPLSNLSPTPDWHWIHDILQIPTPSMSPIIQSSPLAAPAAPSPFEFSRKSDFTSHGRAQGLDFFNNSSGPSPCIHTSHQRHSDAPPTPCACDRRDFRTTLNHAHFATGATMLSPTLSNSPASLMLTLPPSPAAFSDFSGFGATDVGSPASYADLAAFHSPSRSHSWSSDSAAALSPSPQMQLDHAIPAASFDPAAPPPPWSLWPTSDAILPAFATPTVRATDFFPPSTTATQLQPDTPRRRGPRTAKRTASVSSNTSDRASPPRPSAPFPCPHCPKLLKSPSSLRHHLRLHSGPPKRHVCAVCDRAFIRRQDMLRHESVHLAPESWKFKCRGCERGFRRRDGYVGHVRGGRCGVDVKEVEMELGLEGGGLEGLVEEEVEP